MGLGVRTVLCGRRNLAPNGCSKRELEGRLQAGKQGLFYFKTTRRVAARGTQSIRTGRGMQVDLIVEQRILLGWEDGWMWMWDVGCGRREKPVRTPAVGSARVNCRIQQGQLNATHDRLRCLA